MRQALHIFKKDVRYLWYEIAITLALVVMFACNLWWIEFMLPIAWCNLTARLIYAEPLPGDRLFWITRPYAWKSLLAAKALFILIFVTLPMIVADIIILSKNGFGVFDHLAGIVWSQVLLVSVVVLPVVVLATITTGLVQLVLSGLVLLVAVVPLWGLMHAQPASPDWYGLDWIRYSLMIGTFMLAGGIVILRQYKLRRTALARTLTIVAVLLIALQAAFFPWDPAFKAQSWFSKQRIDSASVQIKLDPGRRIAPQKMWPEANALWIHFPIQITGLADGVETRADAVRVTAEAAGAGSRTRILYGRLFSDGGDKFWLAFQLPRSYFERVKGQPITVRTAFYLTLLGNPKATTVSRSNQRVTVPGVGRCTILPETNLLDCLSAFRDIGDSVSVRPASGNLFMVGRPVSYSPYPADLGLSPVFQIIHDLSGRPDSVVIVREEALSHFRKDAEFRDIRLADFTVRPVY